jgi:signal transduction histidine kinase
MEAANLGTWRTELDSDELMVSEIARAIHGIPADKQLLFTETAGMVVSEHRDRVLAAIQAAVDTKGSFNEDYQITPYNNSRRKWINSSGKVELGDDGNVTGVIGTILDITESKEDSQRKDDFIGMVSHELKTPLTSLSGYSQLLQMHAQKKGDSFSNERLIKISSQIRKMNKLITGFLNVSRLEAGKIHLNKELFELNSIILETIDDAVSSTGTHEVVFEPDHDINISADCDKIGSVIFNLISNAIKYSPKATKVIVNSYMLEGNAVVSIKDEGMGIKAEDQERLFDRYYRVESDQMQQIAGFGIGLYLSAEIIKRHNGKIWVESELGKGSMFFFKIPLG